MVRCGDRCLLLMLCRQLQQALRRRQQPLHQPPAPTPLRPQGQAGQQRHMRQRRAGSRRRQGRTSTSTLTTSTSPTCSSRTACACQRTLLPLPAPLGKGQRRQRGRQGSLALLRPLLRAGRRSHPMLRRRTRAVPLAGFRLQVRCALWMEGEGV